MPASLGIALLVALTVVSGCGPTTDQGEGDVLAVDAGGATIAHDVIEGVTGAATERFPARSAAVLAGVLPGTRVRFDLIRDGTALILVRLVPLGDARTSPTVHDRAPRHGGVVTGAEGVVIEIAASPDGRVRAYLSDAWRRPLPVADATGTVRLHLPTGTPTLTFVAADDALEARNPPFAVESVVADVAIAFRGKQLDASVLLDVTGKRVGVSMLPKTACVPLEPAAAGGRTPRCTVTFGSSPTAIGTTADGARAIVAASHGTTTVWSLPDATLVMGIEPLPPIEVSPGQHEPDPRAIVVGRDGTEIAIAAASLIAFYDATTGRFRRQLEGPGGVVQALAWSFDGRRLLVATAADGKAHLLDADDGRVVRTLAAEGRVTAVALDPAGRYAAAATEVGTVVVAELAGDASPRVIAPSPQSLAAVAFAGDRLLTAGADGTLRVFDPTTGSEAARASVGTALTLLAVAPDGRHAATADVERVIRVHRLPDGAVVERLDWHRATIGVLAWGAGQTIVAGDNDGTLALWETGHPE